MRRLTHLIERHGIGAVRLHIDRLIEYTEQRTRAVIRKLPRGTWEADGLLDNDGVTDRPVHLQARVTIAGDGVTFDFTGTDRQRPAPMNCNLTQTFTACVYVLKCLADPDIPLNEGFYRPIQVIAPTGSAVNPQPPTAIVGGWEVNARLCEVLFKALATPLPERVPARHEGHDLSDRLRRARPA